MRKYTVFILLMIGAVTAGGCRSTGGGDFSIELQAGSPVSVEMVRIEAGTFNRYSFEDKKWFPVTVSYGYWIGRYEVTQAQFEAVMGYNPSNPIIRDFPVNQVNYYEAEKFCEKLNKLFQDKIPAGYEFALPSEDQWEYACWAGEKSFNIENLDQYGWLGDKDLNKVGLKKPNNWGIYDMYGNVYEWCQRNRNADDSQGIDAKSEKISSGGSCLVYAEDCHPSKRVGGTPEEKAWDSGFRLVLVPTEKH